MKAYISLGSNIGDRQKHLQDAVDALALVPGINVTAASKIYETLPVGYTEQGNFFNAAVEVETDIGPEALLGVCLGIEAGLGRHRIIKDGPRTIDMDLLLYGDETRNTDYLIIPHPRMAEREFVLKPLSDINAELEVIKNAALTGEGIKDINKSLDVN